MNIEGILKTSLDTFLFQSSMASFYEVSNREILITESRFRGLEDTVAAYKEGQLGWTSPFLEGMALKDPKRAAEALRDDHTLQAECLHEFEARITRYFEGLESGTDKYFAKLNLKSKGGVSVPSVVTGIVNALDFNLFIPIGTLTSNGKSFKDATGTPARMFGSFYFNCVLYPDTTWSANFICRVSLHLSPSDKVAEANSRLSGNHTKSDYELGHFYDVQFDRRMQAKVATDLGIDVPEFADWLSVKKDLYYKKSTGRMPSGSRIERAIALYRTVVSRLTREFYQVVAQQTHAFNALSVTQYCVAYAKQLKFPQEKVSLPPMKSGNIFDTCHISEVLTSVEGKGMAYSSDPGQISTYLEVLRKAIEESRSLEASEDKSRGLFTASVLASADDMFRVIAYELDRSAAIFASYKVRITELLTHLEFFSEELEFYNIPVYKVLDAFMNLFEAAEGVLPQLAKTVRSSGNRLSAVFNPQRGLSVLADPDYRKYWSHLSQIPVDQMGTTLTTSLVELWERFSEMSFTALVELQKNLRKG